MSAEKRWYYSSMGTQHGPVSDSELKELADGKQLLSDDLVCKEGMAEWKPAKSLKGLFSRPIPPPLPATPPPLPAMPHPLPEFDAPSFKQKIGNRWRLLSRRAKASILAGVCLAGLFGLLAMIPLLGKRGRAYASKFA